MGLPPSPGSVVPPRLAAAFLEAGHHLEHLVDPPPDHLALLTQHVELLRQLAQLLTTLFRRVELGLQITHLRLRPLTFAAQGADEFRRLDDLLLQKVELLEVHNDSLRLHPRLRPCRAVRVHRDSAPRSFAWSSRLKAAVIASILSCASWAVSVLSACWNTICTARLAHPAGTPGPRYRSKICTSAIGRRLARRMTRSIASNVVPGAVTIARSRRTPG